MLSRCLFVTTTVVALIAELAYAQDVSFGQRIFHEKADCQFCHGVDGDGRGDPRSPGRASGLRKTFLTPEQLIDVITSTLSAITGHWPARTIERDRYAGASG